MPLSNDRRAPAVTLGRSIGRAVNQRQVAPSRRVRKFHGNRRAIVGVIGAQPKPRKTALPFGRPITHPNRR